MRLAVDDCRARVQTSEVAHLATAAAGGQPHVVPVTFALVSTQVVTAVDQKPKSTTSLRRLRNIAENPRVSVLWDHYDDDWARLWWVRGDGRARIVEPGSHPWTQAVEALLAKYRQYVPDPPRGPAIVVEIATWSGWAYQPERS